LFLDLGAKAPHDTGLRYTPRFTSSDGEIGFRPWRQGATRYRATLHPEIYVFRRRNWFSTLAPRRHAIPGYATPRPCRKNSFWGCKDSILICWSNFLVKLF
jgi:hypothetical protein